MISDPSRKNKCYKINRKHEVAWLFEDGFDFSFWLSTPPHWKNWKEWLKVTFCMFWHSFEFGWGAGQGRIDLALCWLHSLTLLAYLSSGWQGHGPWCRRVEGPSSRERQPANKWDPAESIFLTSSLDTSQFQTLKSKTQRDKTSRAKGLGNRWTLLSLNWLPEEKTGKELNFHHLVWRKKKTACATSFRESTLPIDEPPRNAFPSLDFPCCFLLQVTKARNLNRKRVCVVIARPLVHTLENVVWDSEIDCLASLISQSPIMYHARSDSGFTFFSFFFGVVSLPQTVPDTVIQEIFISEFILQFWNSSITQAFVMRGHHTYTS